MSCLTGCTLSDVDYDLSPKHAVVGLSTTCGPAEDVSRTRYAAGIKAEKVWSVGVSPGTAWNALIIDRLIRFD